MTRLKGGGDSRRWLWIILLLALLGLGGYLLLRGNSAPLTLTQPAEGASVSDPVMITGTGKAGETVTVSENGASLKAAQVAQDGSFSVTLPTPAAGSHTYTVAQTGSGATLTRTVTAAAGTAVPDTAASSTDTPSAATDPSAASAAQTPSSAATTPSTATETPSAATPSAGASSSAPTATDLAFTTPATGSSVPAGALSLSGTGPADTDLSITEDGNTLGTARTDASGAWTFSVPSPAAGAHTYTVIAGSATSDLKLTVAAAAAQAGSCTKPFSLSLKDGARVRQPFRVGGEGSAKSYTVTVSRGSRQIGQKVLPLDASCGWSYTSKPGAGRITYALKESGQSAVARTVTLNVAR